MTKQAALVRSPLGDLIISQGADQDFAFRWGSRDSDGGPVAYHDLSAWSGRAQVRTRVGGEVWLTFATGGATEAGSTLTLDADGYVRIHLHHAETRTPAWNKPARISGVWDLELVDPTGEVIRLVEGNVTVSQSVTRDDLPVTAG